MANS
jgi:hypothetical protein